MTRTSTVEVGRETRDKIQLAMDAMLGVKEARADRNVRPFRGLREAYSFCTGDFDCSRVSRGGMFRVSEAIATTDFPQILLNSLTKKLIQDYAAIGLGNIEQLIVKSTIGDYKTQDRVRMGYLGDLATVNEAAAYVEITKPTDEKISYAPIKKGGLLRQALVFTVVRKGIQLSPFHGGNTSSNLVRDANLINDL